MSEDIKNDPIVSPAMDAPSAPASAPEATIVNSAEPSEAKAPAMEPSQPVTEAATKTAPVKSFLDTAKEMGASVAKQAPGILKTTLTLAGKGAEALSKALHKMSDMVPACKTANCKEHNAPSCDDAPKN